MQTKTRRKKAGLDWSLLLLLSTGYLATSVNMQGFLSLLPFVSDEFALTRAQAGLYSTFFFLSATMIAIFSGRIVDILGSKKGMMLGMGTLGFFMLLHSLVPIFPLILLLAFFTGLGFSMVTPAVNKSIMLKVVPQYRAVSMGIMQSGGGIGSFAGAALMPLLAEYWGWRTAVLFGGIFAILLGALLQFIYSEENSSTPPDKNGREQSSFKDDFLTLIANRNLLYVCGLGTSFGLLMGAVPAHFTLFLTRDLGITPTWAGLGLGILQVGGLIGRPGWGWLTDTVLAGNRRKGLFIMGSSTGLVLILFGIVFTIPGIPASAVFPLALLMGFGTMGWAGLHFTTVSELASAEYTGTATGLALIFSRTGVMISPPLFGLIADMRGQYDLSWILLGLAVVLWAVIFQRTAGEIRIREVSA